MADYVWDIGTGDQMMIRDNGIANGYVEFWFHSDALTWNNQQDWGYDIGEGYVGGVFKLEKNGAWHHLGSVHVPTSRDVMMRMVGEGLGWPTSDRTVFISRATVPPAPYFVTARADSASQIFTQFFGNGDGGTPVREWQVTYGTDPNVGQYYIASNGVNTYTGLAGGTTYYFWARGRNDIGWGPWSARVQVFTWRVPDAPSPVTISQITQKSLRTQFSGGFDGGEPVDEWQLGYGKNPNAPEVLVTSNGTLNLDNLDPGKTYYFWARGRNAVGWGPYSAVRTATLIAGARTNQDGIWKRSVPYVNVGGVPKLARPWVKVAGIWKETPL